jgi:predicted MFS family arabinose efflux permease
MAEAFGWRVTIYGRNVVSQIFFLAAWFLMTQSFARQWPQVSIRP